jgi:membrane fusion protein, multidrug efflux system
MKSTLTTTLAILVLPFAGCDRHSTGNSVTLPTLPPAKVSVATVHVENLPTLTEVMGTIRPIQRAQLAAKVMGTLEEMPVTLGLPVRTGDLLAKISAGEISARLLQVQSQLNAVRRDLARERELLTKAASTSDMVKGLEDRFVATQAMVHEAETMLSYTTIRAPFDGVVARKIANVGDLASPGQPLVEIEGTTDFQVEVAVPDSLVARLSPGLPLAVEVPTSGLCFIGKLAEISSATDSSTRTVFVKITVPANTKVRSGEFARVQLPGASVAALMVPASAVERVGQLERVFVASENNQAVLRLVKTGATRADRVEVLAGLDDNERVILAPPVGLRETQPLELIP